MFSKHRLKPTMLTCTMLNPTYFTKPTAYIVYMVSKLEILGKPCDLITYFLKLAATVLKNYCPYV